MAEIIEISSRNPSRNWTPVTANVADGDQFVARIVDWTGGTGSKPAAGSYIGARGLVSHITDAIRMPMPAELSTTPASSITRTTETIDISGDLYAVCRTTDREGGGWLTITEPSGHQTLVLPARLPAEALPHIIVAYRVGRARGESIGRLWADPRNR